MKFASTWVAALLMTGTTQAELRLLPDAQSQFVFGDGARPLELRWRNAGGETASADINARMFQAGSSTAAPLGQWHWKTLTMLSEQTILESALVEFPAVKAETRFVVQWCEGSNKIIGTTEVLVYPTNLLAELKLLLGEDGVLGVLDPDDLLKPLLNQAGVDIVDLEKGALENFRGKLAVIFPQTSQPFSADFAKNVATLVKTNVALVWIQPDSPDRRKLQPSFYSVIYGNVAAVIAQHELVRNLAENPRSQLNLIQLCRQALHPEPPRLPVLNTNHN